MGQIHTMDQNKSSNYRKRKPILIILVASLIMLGGALGYFTFIDNVDNKKDPYIYVKTGSTLNDLINNLERNEQLNNVASFKLLAVHLGLIKKVKPGRYKLHKNESNYAIIRKLRNGEQEPVKLVINKLRTQNDFLKFMHEKTEADTAALKQLLNNNTFLAKWGLNTSTAMAGIVPDTYEIWWNSTATKTLEKLFGYYKKYWNETRIQQAKALGLSNLEVITLASIVEEETNKHDEKARIASVYLNRLAKGMKLQADPTVKFALNDFGIKRVTHYHTQTTSPYNTYANTGLPPGPICTPSKITIEAVLKPENTKFIYFCAKEDFSGYHSFAENYDEHLTNAAKYHKALNERMIK